MSAFELTLQPRLLHAVLAGTETEGSSESDSSGAVGETAGAGG